MHAGLPYRIEHRLWQNATSVMYHGIHEGSGDALLLRILKLSDDAVRAAWREEVDVLTRLRGDAAVAELVEPCEAWPRAPLVAYRYVELLGTVRHYLDAFPDSVDPLLKVTEDALQLLRSMHAKDVVHGRLTPDALYVNSAGEVVLIDLGRVTSATDTALNRYGYRRRLEDAGPFEPQDDLYAWGMIMRACLKGHPLDGESEEELKSRLTAGNLPTDVGVAPDWIKRSAKELMAFIGKLLQGQFDSADAAFKSLRTFYKPKLAQEPLDVLTERGVELEATIGQGGMGTVYRGRFKDSGERVAIKVMLGEASRDRFLAEASMLEKLKHPHIVRFRDLYDWEVEDETSYILLMEYAPGLPIDVWFEMVGRDVRRLGDLFAQLLETLAYIHEQGYVHRDIKPQNMLVAPGGQLKLLDFGLVKDHDRALTRTGEGLGTLTYMAPEQAREAAKVDGRADVYSAGVLLAKLMCGTGRFANEAQMQTFESLFQSDGFLGAREQGTIVPGPVPPGMVAFLESVIAADPKDRFQSSRQALEVWRRLIHGGCIRAGLEDFYPRVGLHNRTPALRQVWSNMLVEQTPKSVVVYGMPGVGKTRVLHEAAGWVLLQGDADMLWATSMARLGELLEVEPAPEALAQALETRARNTAVLVLLDNNAGSTDDDTQDLLARVGQSKRPAHLVLVATASTRETLSPTDWRTPVRVEALVPHEIEALIKGMLSAKSIDSNLYDALMAASNGIIGVLVKLLAALKENVHYVMFPDTGHAALKPFAHLPVPDEAMAFLRKQLDELEQDKVRFVAGLGVMGETLPMELYEAWAADCFGNTFGDVTTTTRRRNIRVPFIDTLPADRSQRTFSPRLLAHAAAALATPDDRKAAHKLAAMYYAAKMKELLPNIHDNARALVELCRERVRHLRGMGDDAWLDWAAQGADWAYEIRDFPQAETWMNDAVAELEARGPSELLGRCLAMRAAVFTVEGHRKRALDDIERALEMVPSESAHRRDVLLWAPAILMHGGRTDEGLALFEEAVGLTGDGAPAAYVARVLYRKAWIHYTSPMRLTLEDALSACDKALEFAAQPSVPGSVGSFIRNMRGLLNLRGNRDREAEADFLAVATSQHTGGHEAAYAYNNLGLTRWNRRSDGRGAIDAYQQAIKTARRSGLPEILRHPYINLGRVEAQLGDRPDVIMMRFETARKLVSETGPRFAKADIDTERGWALMLLGQGAEAADSFHRVLEAVGDENPELACYALCGLVQLALGSGGNQGVSRWLDDASKLAQKSSNADHQWTVLMTRIQALAMADANTHVDVSMAECLAKMEELICQTTCQHHASGASLRAGELAQARALYNIVLGHLPQFVDGIVAAKDQYERCEVKGVLPNLASQVASVAASRRASLDEEAIATVRGLLDVGITQTRLRGLKQFQKSLEALQRSFQTSSV